MNAPRDLGPDFREWMGDIPPMPDDLPEHTLEQTKRTRQRRSWLWFLPGPKPTAGAQDAQGRAGGPATMHGPRGLLPAPMGGTRTMFSATKLVGMAAVLALMGGLMLAVPLNVTEESPPAATTPDPADYLTTVSGTATLRSTDRDGDVEYGVVGPDGIGYMDEIYTGEIDTDDPRLDGRMRSTSNMYAHHGQATRSLTIYLENDGGSWVGTGYGYQDPETTGYHNRWVLHGEGGYEGQHAVIDMDQSTFSVPFEVSGVIVSGDLPPMPDPAPETFEPTDG
jgi:hypothetical protein